MLPGPPPGGSGVVSPCGFTWFGSPDSARRGAPAAISLATSLARGDHILVEPPASGATRGNGEESARPWAGQAAKARGAGRIETGGAPAATARM